MSASKSKTSVRNRLFEFAIVVVGAEITAFVVYYLARENRINPIFAPPIYAALILIAGYLSIRIISAAIEYVVQPTIGVTRGQGIKNFFQLVAYVVIAVVIFALFGVNLTSAYISTVFLGIVLGLAAQQVLGNIFAGISLLFSKPFEIGDRVTMVTTQYGLIGPSYQHETVVPGYTGVVLDVGIFYTAMLLDEGIPAVLPNSVVTGALVMNHTKTEMRSVRIRIDIDRQVNFEKFKTELFTSLKAKNYQTIESEGMTMDIADMTVSTYQIVVTVWTKQKFEEPVKTLVIQEVLEVQRKFGISESARM